MIVERIRARALTRVDIASLAAFRVIFGGVMFFGILRFIATGWIEPMYGEPTWFFKYPGFAWVEPWSVPGMYVHYGVLALLALLIALGLFYRVAIVLFTLGFLYTQLIDVTNYLNHHYLVVLLGLVLALLPANAAWSFDARRQPSIARTTIPAWFVWLLRFQIGVVYVFAGLAKAKIDWLGYGQPLNLWLAARTETPILGGLFGEPWFALALSWAGFAFDTTIVVWLSWARTRIAAYVTVIMFHGLTGYLFNIGMFPLIMTSSALIFFSPSWPRRLFRLPAVEVKGRADAPRRWVIATVAAFVIIQLALPLRHLVLPGNVVWNERGIRFAWHVLIREKHGAVTFIAELGDNKQLEIPAHNYLTPRQEREMSGQPDLIVQLAHHIAADLRAKGYPVVAIRARTQVSLNGRAPVPMIDPSIDLVTAATDRWILPEPPGPPPHVTVRK
ncbi:MAG: HTTM domain-containing protein [Deltaproteobacteria bacterium]|nr:HTTM domain-containing protein [Deltaproteobacteria bacterium]